MKSHKTSCKNQLLTKPHVQKFALYFQFCRVFDRDGVFGSLFTELHVFDVFWKKSIRNVFQKLEGWLMHVLHPLLSISVDNIRPVHEVNKSNTTFNSAEPSSILDTAGSSWLEGIERIVNAATSVALKHDPFFNFRSFLSRNVNSLSKTTSSSAMSDMITIRDQNKSH